MGDLNVGKTLGRIHLGLIFLVTLSGPLFVRVIFSTKHFIHETSYLQTSVGKAANFKAILRFKSAAEADNQNN